MSLVGKVRGEVKEGGDWRPPFSATISPGNYPCTILSIDPCQIPGFKDKTELHPGYRFLYEIPFEGEDPVIVEREVTAVIAKTGNPSNLFKDLRGMGFEEKLTDEFLKDWDNVNRLLESLVNKQFMMIVELRSSKKDASKKFNRFGGIMEVQKPGRIQSTPIEEDDIPDSFEPSTPHEAGHPGLYDDEDIPF